MKLDIKFSVIVPVYNVEKYLDECIHSVLNQTYKNYELILVNDGSKDASGSICDRYGNEYPNIRVFHKSNGGQLQTREYGIAHATGDFFVFLDSDDYLMTNALQTIYDAIQTYDADCVFYGMQRVVNGEVFDVVTDTLDEPLVVTDKRILFKRVLGSSSYNSLCRKAVKASLVTGVDYSSFYQVRHGEDLLQSIEMLDGASHVVFISDILYNYRVNPSSVTQTVCYEKYIPGFDVRQYVLDYLKKSEIFTNEDFCDYRSYAIQILIDEIEMIAGFQTEFRNKVELFQSLHSSRYYTEFLDSELYDKTSVGIKHILFVLFRKKRFRLIVAISYCFQLLRKLRYRRN